ncbi:hypothetical protein FE784_19865 [Paenibacillus hemerocallicola]|uniref:Uncharacterized protein n=1 Tax=Paenibacillus hemerocallicola TaxID=1172614 RepID=A0A5C4T822_9BACL|nr:hypothetical protein [Paenibacillus hemerocallicola]TNJ64537.1 hypothetical protein FE784_19865 [Paenibacillus hemerocallicola]
MDYNATLDRFNQAINRMESAIMVAIEAHVLQVEIIRKMAERGITPESAQGEIERLKAEIENKIS